MQYTENIGGLYDMNTRYYIRGGKIYCRYNRRTPKKQKPMKGLRSEEIQKALFRQKLISAVLTIILCIVIGCASLFILLMSKNKHIAEMTEIIEPITQEVEEYEVETINYHIDEVGIRNETNVIPNTYHTEIIEEKNSSIITTDYKSMNFVYHETITKSSTELITFENTSFLKMDLPDKFYPGIDFSSFQPGEAYQKITNKTSAAYFISYNENAYTDENGLRRFHVADDQFKVDNMDDYIVAMGTFYKTAGNAGERFLIETTTSKFTVIIGDEKADDNTDPYNMFTLHGVNHDLAGIIEFIYDENHLNKKILSAGTFFNGPDPVLSGEITGIYKIL